jgi:hypothetical protein
MSQPTSSERPLSVVSYDLAYREFLDDAFRGFASDHQLLGDIALVQDRHAGPTRNVRDQIPLDQPMSEGSATMMLERAALRATDVDAHTLMIAQFAEEMIDAQLGMIFKGISEICDAAGTTVKDVGAGIPTIEQIRELLGRMDLAFDDDGRIKQTLFVAPEQEERARQLNVEIAKDPQCARIISEKHKKWIEERAARSRRTLSR